MNIHELDSYQLSDAIKFHDRLNHRLWSNDEHLHPQVRDKLLEIAQDFQEFLGVPDLDVKDITISGSNAAYNYTNHSDIDLHLVVDLPSADSSEVYRELFDAKKYQYNDQHNIKIGGYSVELYVQNPNQEHHSQGIYSLLRNSWISVPKRKQAKIDDISTHSKYQDLSARINDAVTSSDFDRMHSLMAKIKHMRQSGLEQQGEFGSDNLAFKMLRANGLIEKLVTAKTAARDQQLSLQESMRPAPAPVQYGFAEDVSSNPSGVSASTKMFLETENDDEQTVHDFIMYTAKRLGIKHMPHIELHSDPKWSTREQSFGRYTPETHVLEVNLANRHIMDILRTTAHELVHCKQHQTKPLPDGAGKTGSPWENQANAQAGAIMRDYAQANPEKFGDHALGESSGYIPTPAQAQDKRFSTALSVDVHPGQTGREANKMSLQTDAQGRPALLISGLKNALHESKHGVAEGSLNEGLAHPIIVVDVQPEYSGMNDGDESSVFPQIINFVNKQTGPVLMFVNAEDQGMSGDTIQDIKQYWDDTICPEEERYTHDEETDDYIENPNCPKINWQRFAIADKGYGYFRSWMDHGIEPATIIATIRELYQQKKNDSRELQFPASNRRTPQQSLIMGAMQEMEDDPISVNWTSLAQLKRFNGAYIVGGARDQCLREVELLMNAFNIKYKRIDSLIYEGQQGVAEGLSQNQGQVRQTLNAWMNQDQQFKDPTQRAGFQAKVWPYIQKNINAIISDKGKDGLGGYPAAPYAAWLLVQHMDAYPQNQLTFLNWLEKSGLNPDGKLQFLKDRAAVNQWIAANANKPEYFINGKPLPNPTVNVRNPAMFKDAGIVATSREEALQNAQAAGNKLLVSAVQATNAQTQPSYKQGVAEGLDDNGISFQIQKGKNKFATTLSIGNNSVGVYQYDANTGRSIAEVYPEFKGKGLGKLLVLHAIYTAAKLGLDFQEDESRTSEYDNVLDSLSGSGYIVDDEGYWYVTGEGEQFLKQSLKQGVAEGKDFDQCFDQACKLYDRAVNKNLEPKLVQVADFQGDGTGADASWLKLPQQVWQHYVVIVGDQVLDPTAKQFGDTMPTQYQVSDLDRLWGKQYQIRPRQGMAEGSGADNNVINHMAKNLTGSGSPIAKIRHKRDTEREQLGPISYGYRQDPNLKTTHKQVPFSENVTNESLDHPYKILRWEKGDFGDVDAITRLDDGTFLSIMFNKGFSKDTKEEAWSVEFYRNNSQAKTGEGDQQRVFATVLSAIQIFIEKYKPNKITFSASKEVEPDDDQRKALTRAKLYDSLVQRYARAWGYRSFRAENGNIVIYQLSRINKDVTEAGVGPAFRESVAHLKALGYKHIGSGADARVWAKDTSHVIKILMPDKPGNHAEITFKKFYRFCELHPEISCLPIFNDVNTIDLAGEDYTQIDMEHLQPIAKGSIQEAMVWILSDYAQTGETWQQILPSLTDPETWEFMSNSRASVIARLIDDEMTHRGVTFYKTYATLFRIMKVLYQLYPKEWDLHTENVMQRANGELVIIDPWFSDGLKSL